VENDENCMQKANGHRTEAKPSVTGGGGKRRPPHGPALQTTL